MLEEQERDLLDAQTGEAVAKPMIHPAEVSGRLAGPRLTVTATPWPWLDLSATAGGFYLPFRDGDTSMVDPMQYTLEARARWDRYSVAVGYELYHVHLEERSTHTSEDIVHMRLRGLFLSIEAGF